MFGGTGAKAPDPRRKFLQTTAGYLTGKALSWNRQSRWVDAPPRSAVFSRDQAPWMRESAKPVCCADARRRSAARMRDARTRAGVRRSLRGGPGQRMSLWVHGLAG